jgi:hypothetical protein
LQDKYKKLKANDPRRAEIQGRNHEDVSGTWKSDRRMSAFTTTNAGDACILPDVVCFHRVTTSALDPLDPRSVRVRIRTTSFPILMAIAMVIGPENDSYNRRSSASQDDDDYAPDDDLLFPLGAERSYPVLADEQSRSASGSNGSFASTGAAMPRQDGTDNVRGIRPLSMERNSMI